MYPPDSLYHVTCGLTRYFKEDLNRPEMTLLDKRNPKYQHFQKCLDNQMALATNLQLAKLTEQHGFIHTNSTFTSKLELSNIPSPEQNQDDDSLRPNSQVPENTKRIINWALNTWNIWAKMRNKVKQPSEPYVPKMEDFGLLTERDIILHLENFITEVRKADGSMLKRKSLYSLAHGLMLHFTNALKRPALAILDRKNPKFKKFQQCLDSQMELAQNHQNGTENNKLKTLTDEQEKYLWQKGYFGTDEAEKLQITVHYFLSSKFGIKGRAVHRNLKVEDFEFGSNHNGRFVKFLKGAPRSIKPGYSARRLNELKRLKQYDTSDPNSVYKLLQLYLSCIPKAGDFYRRPSPVPGLKYSNEPIGVNKLAKYRTSIFDAACFQGNNKKHVHKTKDTTKTCCVGNKTDAECSEFTNSQSSQLEPSDMVSQEGSSILTTGGQQESFPVNSALTKKENADRQRPKLFQCIICQTYFTCQKHVKRHLTAVHQVHQKQKPFACSFCGHALDSWYTTLDKVGS